MLGSPPLHHEALLSRRIVVFPPDETPILCHELETRVISKRNLTFNNRILVHALSRDADLCGTSDTRRAWRHGHLMKGRRSKVHLQTIGYDQYDMIRSRS